MPGNDGRSLESLVSMIEAYFVPSGFTVETRKRVYEDGVQIAELDIIITGRVGTSSFTGLIECRDRPSEGAAPVSWIEQLVGRRDRFKLSSVMAVSTTGFARGAVSYAAQTGIALRMFEALTYEAFKHWLPLDSPLLICDAPQLQAVRFFLKPLSEATDPRPWPLRVLSTDAVFVNIDTGELVSINQIWDNITKQTSLYDDVIPDAPPVLRTVIANDAITNQYKFHHDDCSRVIDRCEFDVLLHSYHPRSPLTFAVNYNAQHVDADGNESFAAVARWQGTDDDLIKELTLIAIPKDGKSGYTQTHTPPKHLE